MVHIKNHYKIKSFHYLMITGFYFAVSFET